MAHDIIAWFMGKPTLSSGKLSASMVKQGYVVPVNGYSVPYMEFGLKNPTRGVIGMSTANKRASVAGGFPSTALIQFVTNNVTGSVVSDKGTASDDGFTGCRNAGPGQVGRRGD